MPTTDPPNDAMLQKLDAIVEQLKRPPIPPRDVLWTNQDIANWLQLSLNTVTARVLNRPEFPAPLQPCDTGERAGKRWFAADVIQWGRQHRHTAPKSRLARTRQSSREATSEAVAL